MRFVNRSVNWMNMIEIHTQKFNSNKVYLISQNLAIWSEQPERRSRLSLVFAGPCYMFSLDFPSGRQCSPGNSKITVSRTLCPNPNLAKPNTLVLEYS